MYRGGNATENVIKAWENSSGHASTMLNAGYQSYTTCVASCNGVWVMTIFGPNGFADVKEFASNNYFVR